MTGSEEMTLGRTTDEQQADPGSKKVQKAWEKPEIRRGKLTEEELAALRQSDDPEGLLRKMWPDLKGRKQS